MWHQRRYWSSICHSENMPHHIPSAPQILPASDCCHCCAWALLEHNAKGTGAVPGCWLTLVTNILQNLRQGFPFLDLQRKWMKSVLRWSILSKKQNQIWKTYQELICPGRSAFTPPITATRSRMRHLGRIKNNSKNENQVWKPLLSFLVEGVEEGEHLNLNFLL